MLLDDSLKVLVCDGQSDHALLVSVTCHQVVHRTLVLLHTLLSRKVTILTVILIRIKRNLLYINLLWKI